MTSDAWFLLFCVVMFALLILGVFLLDHLEMRTRQRQRERVRRMIAKKLQAQLPEPHIPTAMEDWDAESKRRTEGAGLPPL